MGVDSDKEVLYQLIGFNVGRKLFGADILSVREILRGPSIVSVDNGPSFIEGIVRIRGEAIPVVDLKRRMGHSQSSDESMANWVLITRTGGHVTGFVVDAVTRILKISSDEILPAPELILAGLRSQYIRGVCNSDLGLLIVLELDRILAAQEIKTLKQMNIQ